MQKFIYYSCRNNDEFTEFSNKLNKFLEKGGRVVHYCPNVSYYPGIQAIVEADDPRLFDYLEQDEILIQIKKSKK